MSEAGTDDSIPGMVRIGSIYLTKGGPDGYDVVCKECRRYKITLPDMFEQHVQ